MFNEKRHKYIPIISLRVAIVLSSVAGETVGDSQATMSLLMRLWLTESDPWTPSSLQADLVTIIHDCIKQQLCHYSFGNFDSLGIAILWAWHHSNMEWDIGGLPSKRPPRRRISLTCDMLTDLLPAVGEYRITKHIISVDFTNFASPVKSPINPQCSNWHKHQRPQRLSTHIRTRVAFGDLIRPMSSNCTVAE